MPRAHRPRRLAVAATALAGALAFSACEGGGDPTLSAPPTSPTTTAPPSTTTSSAPLTTVTSSSPGYVPVKPAYPSDAKKQTRAGAEAFIRYYFAALNYSWMKPDALILIDLGDETCNSCKSLSATAQELVATNEKYTSLPARVTGIEYALGDDVNMRFVVDIHQFKSERVSSAGDVVGVDREKTLKRIVGVKWGVDRWRINLIGAG